MGGRVAAGVSEAARDARELGVSEDVIAALEQAENTNRNEIGVWAENWDIVAAFTTILTQWRVVALPNGRLRWLGLDYAGAGAGLTLAGAAMTPDLWAGIRTMEAAGRAAANGD